MKTHPETCANKTLYFDEHEAKMNVIRVEAKYGRRLEPYKCNVCGYWHLTHFEQRKSA